MPTHIKLYMYGTMADRCHTTSRAMHVLYSTAHVSLARARARACTI